MRKHIYSILVKRNDVRINYPVCRTNSDKYADSKIKEKKTSLRKCLKPDCDFYLLIDGIFYKKL